MLTEQEKVEIRSNEGKWEITEMETGVTEPYMEQINQNSTLMSKSERVVLIGGVPGLCQPMALHKIYKLLGKYLRFWCHKEELSMNSLCLYVSDLDGTLLRSDETLSQFTIDTINELTSKGMLFSYATARSLVTAKKVTRGLNTHFPLIVYNGAFIIDNVTEEIILANYFEKDIAEVFEDLFKNSVYPLVYAYINGVEKFSFIPEKCTEGMHKFIQSRSGDKRINIVGNPAELTKGDMFYITCIDTPKRLEPFYYKYREKYHVVYQRDIYTGEQWLEIMPKKTSKSNAIKKLKEILKAQNLVTFGDGKNDIDMFEMSDECCAVENAEDELKTIATQVIESNNDDGVAKWLRENVIL